MQDISVSKKRQLIINYSVLDLDNDLGQGAKGRCP